MEAVVARIDPLSHDSYPDKPAAVIHLGGCNLKCPWCYVPQMLSTSQCMRMKLDEIVEEISHAEMIEAVVFNGGEPLLQPRVLEYLCTEFRAKGLSTKVQTNGTMPGVLGNLLSKRLLSRVSIDVKAPFDNERLYAKMAGVRSTKIANDVKKALSMCRAFNTPLDATVPVVPVFNDKPRTIRSIARECAPYVDMLTLIEFDNRVTLDPRLKDIQPPTRDELHELALQCKPYIPNTRIRTRTYGEEAL